jgi:hypothetical protein
MSKSMSKLSGMLSAAVLLLAWASAPALADTSYMPSGSFAATQGSGDGEISDPQHAAVQSSTGNILLVDRGNNRVQVFAPDGAGSASYLTQFGAGVLDGPSGIAIDQSTGDVYVSDADDVVKFTSNGALVPIYTQDLTFTSPGVAGPLAFDQGAHELVVGAGDHLRRYGTGGVAGTSSDGADSGAAFSYLNDIAAQGDGDVVVIDGGRVLRFKRDGSFAATVTGLPGSADVVTAVPGTDNVLLGHNGGPDDTYTAPEPASLYRVSGDTYHGMTGVGPQVLRGLVVSAAIGSPLYVVTGAEWFGGTPGVTSYQPFAVQPPAISKLRAVEDELTAGLRGKVDPQQDGTTWSFEYGTTAAYGKRAPAAPATIAGGVGPVAVAQTIAGLSAGTTYHYRLVATNGGGTSYSADQTFTTTTTEPAGETQGNGRAYEMVSPLEKSGAGVFGYYTPGGEAGGAISASVQISPDGNAVAFSATGVLPGAEAAPGWGRYLARRSAVDWTTTAIDPPQRASGVGARTQYAFAMSDDLSRTLVYSNRALTPDGVEDNNNLYIRDNGTNNYTLVATSPQLENWADSGDGYFRLSGHSVDLSRVLFYSRARLTPDAPLGPNTYEWIEGQGLKVLLAPSSDGMVGASPADSSGDRPLRQAMSRDGRKILVVPRAEGDQDVGCSGMCLGMYLLRDGQPPLQVSASQRTGDDPSQPQSVHYLGSSRDQSVVYFSSAAALTDASDTNDGQTDTIYRYDLDSKELTDLLAGVPVADRLNTGLGSERAAVTPDGSRVYFMAAGHLVSGVPSDNRQLYTWHDGALTRVPTTGGVGIGATLYRGLTSFSDNGRYFAFVWNADLTDYESNGNNQMYLYDAVLNKFSCVSCNPNGEPPHGSSEFNPMTNFGLQHNSRGVLDDGTVAFSSSDGLVRGDVNGKRDVYTWRDGKLTLISTGKGASDALFTDMSADGSTIAFVTAGRLVARDTDELNDLYVSRIGGGLAAQMHAADAGRRPACVGAACQGPATPAVIAPVAASVTFAGEGDLLTAVRRHLKVGASKARSIVGSAAAVSVTAPAKGKIRLSGSGLSATSRTVAKAGRYTVMARLTSAARKRLAKSRRYTTSARVTFATADGATASTTVKLTFKLKNTTKTKKGL